MTAVTPPSLASAINYTWDDSGDLTARGSDSFSWDYEDRMVSATVSSVTTTFAYRGDGLRNSKTTGGNTTTFTWDIATGLPVVLDDGNQYLYGAGLVAQKQSGSWYYYLGGGLVSPLPETPMRIFPPAVCVRSLPRRAALRRENYPGNSQGSPSSHSAERNH